MALDDTGRRDRDGTGRRDRGDTDRDGLDDTERQVLDALVADGRAGPRKIASATGVAVHRVVDAIDRLEDADVIEGYEPRVDYTALGYDVTAIVKLRVDGDAIAGTVDRLGEHQSVTSVYEVTGAPDVVAIAKFDDESALDAWAGELSTDEAVRSLSTTLVTDVVREGWPFPPGE